MNANKQLINLAGVLGVVVVLVAGIALVAFPMYSESRAIDDQTRTVSTNNTIYEQQVAILAEAGARIDQIDADLAALRAQIASDTQLDDIHALIADTAKDLDIRVVSVAADEAEPWTPRTQVDEDGNVVADAAPAVADGGGTGAAATPEPTPAASGEDPAATPAAPAPAAPEGGDASPQRQVLITVTLDLSLPFESQAETETDAEEGEDAAVDAEEVTARAMTASSFVDALTRGPRLVLPINVAYTNGTLVVSALTYFRTEDTP